MIDPSVRDPAGARRRTVVAVALVAILFAYLAVAWLVEPGRHYRGIDIIDMFSIFNADDSFRYYLARQAFDLPRLFSWSYTYPAALLLDGLVLQVVGDSLLLARAVFASLAVASLVLLYRTAVLLGASSASALVAMILVGTMPVYAFVSMSFLGEKWLLLFSVVGLYLFASGRVMAACLAFSVLTLVRPEGLFFITPLFLCFLSRKQLSYCAALVLPGTLYFVWLLFSLPSIDAFWHWRLEYRAYTNHLEFPHLYSPLGFLVTFNLFWILLGLSGFLLQRPKRFMLFWVGAALVFSYHVISTALWLEFYEPRYYAILVPLIGIFVALGLDSLVAKLWGVGHRWRMGWIVPALMVSTILVGWAAQIDEIRRDVFSGWRFPLNHNRGVCNPGAGYDTESIGNIRAISEAIATATRVEQVSRIFIPIQNDLFYILDPDSLNGVRTVYLPIPYSLFADHFDGSLFGMFPYENKYAYFSLYGDDDDEARRKRGLYIGDMRDCEACVAVAKAGNIGVYQVFYHETREPLKWPGQGSVVQE